MRGKGTWRLVHSVLKQKAGAFQMLITWGKRGGTDCIRRTEKKAYLSFIPCYEYRSHILVASQAYRDKVRESERFERTPWPLA